MWLAPRKWGVNGEWMNALLTSLNCNHFAFTQQPRAKGVSLPELRSAGLTLEWGVNGIFRKSGKRQWSLDLLFVRTHCMIVLQYFITQPPKVPITPSASECSPSHIKKQKLNQIFIKLNSALCLMGTLILRRHSESCSFWLQRQFLKRKWGLERPWRGRCQLIHSLCTLP